MRSDAPRFDEMRAPVVGFQSVRAHSTTGRWGVHEAAMADVDADVRGLLAFLIEEYEVASAQFARRHRTSLQSLRLRVARKRDANLGIAVLHQPAAIEAGRGVAAPAVRL